MIKTKEPIKGERVTLREIATHLLRMAERHDAFSDAVMDSELFYLPLRDSGWDPLYYKKALEIRIHILPKDK